MSLDTFRRLFARLPPTLTQIAFGIGDIDGNPEMWDIFRHCRDHGVVPNVTINGSRMTDAAYDLFAELCGAVAVSYYSEACFDAVAELSRRGLEQVNIHYLLAEETYTEAVALVEKAKTYSRLAGLNAIVFLAAKPVGRSMLTSMADPERYRALIEVAMKRGVGIGFDSCSAPLFLKAMQSHESYAALEQMAEPCESGLFSVYIDVRAQQYPCSFLQHAGVEGVDVLETESFLDEIWNSPRAEAWRKRLLATTRDGLVHGCRQCPVFDLYGEKQ